MKRLLELTEWPLAVMAVGLLIAAGQSRLAQAQEVNVEAGGTTIQVGPDKGAANGTNVKVDVQAAGPNEIVIEGQPENAAPVAKRYLIGVMGGEVSPELRAHLGLQKNGVIVRGVSRGSAAEKAGIQQHDIIIQAGGNPVADMSELANLVREVGPTGGSVELVVIRGGKQETVVVKPEERVVPQAVNRSGVIGRRPGGDGLQGLEGMLGGLLGGRGEGQPFQFRMFGPGLMIDGQNVQLQGMNGTSVSVQRQNGQTRVKVTQGDKTWEVDGSDEEAIASLPPEVRGMVEGMLNGEGAGAGINIDLNDLMPDLDALKGEGLNIFGRGGIAPQEEINRRMIEMEQQMQELRRRIMGEVPAENFPPNAADEAPAFEPDVEVDEGPVEVEIPAEK